MSGELSHLNPESPSIKCYWFEPIVTIVMLYSSDSSGELGLILVADFVSCMVNLKFFITFIFHEVFQVIKILLVIKDFFTEGSSIIVVNNTSFLKSLRSPVMEVFSHPVVCLSYNCVVLLLHSPMIFFHCVFKV